MSRRRDPDARTIVRPPGEYRATIEAYLREKEIEFSWTIDPHDSTPNTLAVEDAAARIEQLLGE